MADLQTTDFFGRQDRARKHTTLLVVLYTLAVVLTCAAVAGLAVLIALITHQSEASRGPDPAMLALFAGGGAAGAALLIAGGTAYRISELRGGGMSVALALGGRPIDQSTTDADERMVLNVVEEMSIASGVPVPPVFMLEQETGINAFAAGYSPGDAVIGVTRGCVHGLTRDEFQGVMAHEFSHILNGDMRLNIRLVGILGGIVLLSLAGYTLMRATYYRSMARSKDNKGVVVILVLGVGLIVIGGIGSLFARMIQAAVSRQREFLADASAVQFTRNPEGIAGALRRIGGAPKRAAIMNAHSREMSHLFFGNAVGASSFLGASLASHPPLKKRIRAVLPTWDGTFLTPKPPKPLPQDTATKKKPGPRQQLEDIMQERMAPHGGAPTGAAAALPLLALIGTAGLEHAGHARTLLDRMPRALKDAARDPYGCRAVVYALLMHWDGDDASLRTQLDILDAQSDTGVAALVRSLAKDVAPLDGDLRLPLIDLCLGSLSRLSETQHTTFRAVIHTLAMADNELTPTEWALLRIVETHLDERFNNARPTSVKYYALGQLGPQVSVMLGAIARSDSDEPGVAQKAFDAGAAILQRGSGMAPDLSLPTAAERTPEKLDAALEELRAVAPRMKARLLEAAAVVVAHDHAVTPSEADLLRAFADLLGVPMPPLLPGQKLV
ncbi:MAG: M48 family metallopeptidase [Phycisphaera sp.]|nr:MAG: M48 family metallopeptidase [Phycisphaera sp.]